MKQEIFDLRETINNSNILIRLFFKWKFNKCVRISKLKKEDVILDFGCGGKYLKYILSRYNVISYDKNKRFSEVRSYKDFKPTKIFAIDVLEHLSKKEIKETIKNFKEMKNEFILITAIPNENWFWRFSRSCLGLTPYVRDHITPRKKIIKILNEELSQEEVSNFFMVCSIYKYKWDAWRG